MMINDPYQEKASNILDNIRKGNVEDKHAGKKLLVARVVTALGVSGLVSVATFGITTALGLDVPLLSAAGLGLPVYMVGRQVLKTYLELAAQKKVKALKEQLSKLSVESDPLARFEKKEEDKGPSFH